eukprot:scaffold151799_cov58-Cyclotella_meneghiniana.AAC.1
MVEIGIHSLQWSPQADYRVKVGLNSPSSAVPDSGTKIKIVTAGVYTLISQQLDCSNISLLV